MSLSVNTNPGALIALQNLNTTESQLQTAQNQVSTGLAISQSVQRDMTAMLYDSPRRTRCCHEAHTVLKCSDYPLDLRVCARESR